MVKLKLSRFRHRTRLFTKKKDKIAGGRNNTNDFNGGGDGEKKKEKDPSKVQQIMKPLELEHIESDDGGITKSRDVASEVNSLVGKWLEVWMNQLNNKTSLGGGDAESNGDGGGDNDNNGSGGGTNNKKGSDRDGDGNGDKNKSDRDSDGGGEMKGNNMDFKGKAVFGYRYGYHAGNENEYPVGQLQCAQEVQSQNPNACSIMQL